MEAVALHKALMAPLRLQSLDSRRLRVQDIVCSLKPMHIFLYLHPSDLCTRVCNKVVKNSITKIDK